MTWGEQGRSAWSRMARRIAASVSSGASQAGSCSGSGVRPSNEESGPEGRGKAEGDLGRDTPRASADDDQIAGAERESWPDGRSAAGKRHKLDPIGRDSVKPTSAGPRCSISGDDPLGRRFNASSNAASRSMALQ